MRRVLKLRSLTVLFVIAALTASYAWARPDDHGDPHARGGKKGKGLGIRATAMPFVEGANAEEAIKRLEQLRLQVRVITIAGRAPDIVDRQQPKPNSVVQPGEEVVIFVGVEPFVQTIVPDARGMLQEDAAARLEEAYVLDIKLVQGHRRDAGRVVAQRPKAGRRLALRGVLELDVVRPSLTVPSFLGKREAEARALADALGLVLDVDYAVQVATAPDRVLSQYPQQGTEILPGGLVRVQISGGGGGQLPNAQVAVPRLLGASLADAQRALLSVGLIPHIEFASGTRARAYTVISQEEAPGTLLESGEHVHFTVARPINSGGAIEVPSFLGMRGADASRIANSMGLNTVVERKASGLRAGTVLGQSPTEGSRVRTGSQVLLTVAARPGNDFQQQTVVPRLVGLDVLRARAALFASGLGVTIRRAEAPGEPVGRISHQSPAAGRAIRKGSKVTIVLPIATTMPDLVGRSLQRAEQLLRSAGLIGVPDGPRFGVGSTQVMRQELPPGTQVARGSEVSFRFVVTGTAGHVRVPNLRGMSKNRAAQAGQDAGIVIVFRGSGGPLHRVVAQSVSAGTSVPRGTNIVATLAPVGAGPGGGVALVPSITNRSLREARQMIQDAGFRIEIVGTGNFTDQSVIVGQSPAAGTRLAKGTVVTAQLGAVQGPGVGTVEVPDVMGKSKRRAKEILQAAGLTVRVRGLDINVRGVKTKVRKQDPAAGTIVDAGTEVTITLSF